MTSPVTAVGRLLQPKGNEPRILHRIAIRKDGNVRTIQRRELPAMPSATATVDRRR
jgi:hypothetical protein